MQFLKIFSTVFYFINLNLGFYNIQQNQIVRLDNGEGKVERHAIYSSILYFLVLVFVGIALLLTSFAVIEKIKELRNKSKTPVLSETGNENNVSSAEYSKMEEVQEGE
jgi:hypothetical protein